MIIEFVLKMGGVPVKLFQCYSHLSWEENTEYAVVLGRTIQAIAEFLEFFQFPVFPSSIRDFYAERLSHPKLQDKPFFYRRTQWSLNASRWGYVIAQAELNFGEERGFLYLCYREPRTALLSTEDRLILLHLVEGETKRIVPWTYLYDGEALRVWLWFRALVTGNLDGFTRTRDIEDFVEELSERFNKGTAPGWVEEKETLRVF
ncbi:MAG: hypothetical protein QXR87_06905 [Candidatus Hadarchaeales archaeon]